MRVFLFVPEQDTQRHCFLRTQRPETLTYTSDPNHSDFLTWGLSWHHSWSQHAPQVPQPQPPRAQSSSASPLPIPGNSRSLGCKFVRPGTSHWRLTFTRCLIRKPWECKGLVVKAMGLSEGCWYQKSFQPSPGAVPGRSPWCAQWKRDGATDTHLSKRYITS